jgi:hypothetical protein
MSAVSIGLWAALGLVATILVGVCGYVLTRKTGAGWAKALMVASSAAGAFIILYLAVSTFIMQYLVH